MSFNKPNLQEEYWFGCLECGQKVSRRWDFGLLDPFGYCRSSILSNVVLVEDNPHLGV